MNFAAAFVVFSLCIPSFINAHEQLHSETFLPENDLHLQDNPRITTNFGEEEFNAIIDRVGVIYEPIVTNHGGTLKLNKRWKDSTVNASANRQGKTWNVNMFGGLARRPEVTLDGFTTVLCHEMGHHVGGFPFYRGDWASNEGQADYFATQSCVRILWRDELEANAQHRMFIDPIARAKCDEAYADTAAQDLCYRIANAGHSLARLLAALKNNPEPQFGTPDTKEVTRTFEGHPDGQCRLDTYFQGGLCTARFDENIIPGLRHASGQDSEGAENEAATYSCTATGGHKLGIRPRCWFKNRL